MKESKMIFKEFKKIRESNNMEVYDKCSKCEKKFKDNEIIYPVKHGDNYKFVCKKCNGKDIENANRTVYKADTIEKENVTATVSEQDE